VTQPLPLRDQLKSLEHLQELDLKLDRLKHNKNSLPATLRAMDAGVAKLKQQVQLKKTAITEMEKARSQTGAALDLNKDRLARANGKLEGVQNGQEFQAANKEIEQLKKLNATLDEQLKKAAQDIELANKEAGEIETQITKAEQDRTKQAETVSGQESQVGTEITSLMKERSKYTAGVEARLLAQYDRVRGARAGLGIVPAIAGRCKGCNMVVPPQLYNEVHKGTQIHACPSCHRILFVPMAQAPSEAKSG
jgi:predicted  nucleic acid-binding Zn-ribbon protein